MFEQLKIKWNNYWAGVKLRWDEMRTIEPDRPCPQPGLTGLRLPVGCFIERGKDET